MQLSDGPARALSACVIAVDDNPHLLHLVAQMKAGQLEGPPTPPPIQTKAQVSGRQRTRPIACERPSLRSNNPPQEREAKVRQDCPNNNHTDTVTVD